MMKIKMKRLSNLIKALSLSTQIQDLFQENQEISYNENLTDPVLDSIPQKFTTREETGKPQTT